MAEKLETVVSRGDQNTRQRDYYDVYILAKLQYKNIEIESLKAAIEATSKKRGSKEVLKNYKHKERGCYAARRGRRISA